MPSVWPQDGQCDWAAREPRQRSHSAHHRRPARRLRHHSHNGELPTEFLQMDPHYIGNADSTSFGDQVADFQSNDEIMGAATAENTYHEVKVLQYKTENGRLKDLLRTRTHELREKCSALSICQTELAEALISQTADDGCVQDRRINKLARDIKERLCHSEMQMKLLREERDQAELDLTTLAGKMTTCTTIAEEQAKLLKGQQGTIRKFEQKIQTLEKSLEETRAGQQATVQEFESSILNMQAQHKERIHDYENSLEDMEVKQKEERTALEEQLGLHQQRAALQDRKLKKYHHDLHTARSELSMEKQREAEIEDELRAQTSICQDTTKELCAATKEIEQLNNLSLEIVEQEERMEQLWLDNTRLVQLLCDCDEYQNLFLEMQGGKGLVFCPSHFKVSKFQELAQRYGSGSGYGPANPKTEREQWIPAELYDLVMAFRSQHCMGLEIEIVRELLRIMSTFWREQHKKSLYQVKTRYKKQVTDLKRQLSHRLPYGQVVQSAEGRPAKNITQSKAFRRASPAARGEHYCHPEPRPLSRDVDDFWVAPGTRRSRNYRSSSPF